MTTETTTTELDLDAIETRVPAVYDGPWYVQLADDGRWLVGYPTDNPLAGLIATVPDYGEQLAEFTAAARTDVPALVAEVRRLRAELATVTSQRDAHEATAGELRQDLREADDSIGFLQQHIANIRNGDA